MTIAKSPTATEETLQPQKVEFYDTADYIIPYKAGEHSESYVYTPAQLDKAHENYVTFKAALSERGFLGEPGEEATIQLKQSTQREKRVNLSTGKNSPNSKRWDPHSGAVAAFDLQKGAISRLSRSIVDNDDGGYFTEDGYSLHDVTKKRTVEEVLEIFDKFTLYATSSLESFGVEANKLNRRKLLILRSTTHWGWGEENHFVAVQRALPYLQIEGISMDLLVILKEFAQHNMTAPLFSFDEVRELMDLPVTIVKPFLNPYDNFY